MEIHQLKDKISFNEIILFVRREYFLGDMLHNSVISTCKTLADLSKQFLLYFTYNLNWRCGVFTLLQDGGNKHNKASIILIAQVMCQVEWSLSF